MPNVFPDDILAAIRRLRKDLDAITAVVNEAGPWTYDGSTLSPTVPPANLVVDTTSGFHIAADDGSNQWSITTSSSGQAPLQLGASGSVDIDAGNRVNVTTVDDVNVTAGDDVNISAGGTGSLELGGSGTASITIADDNRITIDADTDDVYIEGVAMRLIADVLIDGGNVFTAVGVPTTHIGVSDVSRFGLWLDDTIGATKLMVYARDSAGTVRTTAIALT